jgi:hypothetical protein
MAQKEQVTIENSYFGYAETATNTIREMWGWQIKTAQNFFDQGLRAAQTWSDFSQTQVQEGARLSQEIMKMGLQNTEEAKKSFHNLSEKILSPNK